MLMVMYFLVKLPAVFNTASGLFSSTVRSPLSFITITLLNGASAWIKRCTNAIYTHFLETLSIQLNHLFFEH